VILHIGAPKAGSTYLQQLLWHHRELLGNHGVGYPLDEPMEHFTATMDLRDMTWGGSRDAAWDGAWDRVAARAREWPGHTVVISNELLGGADPAQIQRAVQSLQPAEVRVVFIARDLARQLPSDWQEQVKHTHTIPFDDFVDDLVANGLAAQAPYGPMFWGLHDPVHVLRPWADVVGSGNVVVITAPQAGAARNTLWRRFATTLDIDPDAIDPAAERGNPSLGAVEAELLRRINERADLLEPRKYREELRGRLIEEVMRRGPDRPRIALPERHLDWLAKRSAELVDGLRDAGYVIVGDLADLQPAPVADGAVEPGRLSDSELLDAALNAFAALLVERITPTDEA
jgi:hypothetical protein